MAKTIGTNPKGCLMPVILTVVLVLVVAGGPVGCGLALLAVLGFCFYRLVKFISRTGNPKMPSPLPVSGLGGPRGPAPTPQTKRPTQEELAALIGGIKLTITGSPDYTPRKLMAKNPAPYWKPAGSDVEVGGFNLGAGLLYVGSNLASVTGYNVEPALVDLTSSPLLYQGW